MTLVRFYLPLPISVTVSISTVSAFIFLALIPHIAILFVIPLLLWAPFTWLDTGEIHCHAIMINID